MSEFNNCQCLILINCYERAVSGEYGIKGLMCANCNKMHPDATIRRTLLSDDADALCRRLEAEGMISMRHTFRQMFLAIDTIGEVAKP